MPRFEGDIFDNECKHGIFPKYACGDCKPKPKVIKAKGKDAPAEGNDKPVVPKCSICRKKAKKSLGHTNHRTYVKLYSGSTVHGRNPERSIGAVQQRAVFNATHQDDKGKWVCDECCQRCTRCKSGTVGVAGGSSEAIIERVSVPIQALSENNPVMLAMN